MLDSPHPPGEAVVIITMTTVTSVMMMMSDWLSPGLLDRHHPPSLLGQLHPGLGVGVEHGEVGDDDGDGERYNQHPGEGAQGAHDDPGVCLGYHVPVSHSSHGHHRPPQSLRN